jgi:hypothetical protein
MSSSVPPSARVLTLTPALGLLLPFRRQWPSKTAFETPSYAIDASRYLQPASDVILQADTEITGTDAALTAIGDWTTQTVRYRLVGGTPGQHYVVTSFIVLQSGQTLSISVGIRIAIGGTAPVILTGQLSLNRLPITIGRRPIVLTGKTAALLISRQPITIGFRPIILE